MPGAVIMSDGKHCCICLHVPSGYTEPINTSWIMTSSSELKSWEFSLPFLDLSASVH